MAAKATVKLLGWNLASLHPAKPRPVADLQKRYPCQEDLYDVRAEAMGYQQVRVNGVQLIDEHLQHWALALEHMYV